MDREVNEKEITIMKHRHVSLQVRAAVMGSEQTDISR